MPNPTAPAEGSGLTIDLITDAAGTAFLKRAVASNVVTGATQDAAWQGIATHQEAETGFGFGSPTVVVAGADPAGAVRGLAVTSNGTLKVEYAGGTLAHGARAMTGGAKIALTTTSTPCSGVLVKAYSGNSATVYVGGPGVTADTTPGTGGYPLGASESVGVPCRNATEVYIVGTGTDGVAWIAARD